MPKVIIEQDYLPLNKNGRSHKKMKKENSIKIDDALFEIALRKGLIEETKDGYVFVGNYEELLAFKKRKTPKSFEWLD